MCIWENTHFLTRNIEWIRIIKKILFLCKYFNEFSKASNIMNITVTWLFFTHTPMYICIHLETNDKLHKKLKTFKNFIRFTENCF